MHPVDSNKLLISIRFHLEIDFYLSKEEKKKRTIKISRTLFTIEFYNTKNYLKYKFKMANLLYKFNNKTIKHTQMAMMIKSLSTYEPK